MGLKSFQPLSTLWTGGTRSFQSLGNLQAGGTQSGLAISTPGTGWTRSCRPPGALWISGSQVVSAPKYPMDWRNTVFFCLPGTQGLDWRDTVRQAPRYSVGWWESVISPPQAPDDCVLEHASDWGVIREFPKNKNKNKTKNVRGRCSWRALPGLGNL